MSFLAQQSHLLILHSPLRCREQKRLLVLGLCRLVDHLLEFVDRRKRRWCLSVSHYGNLETQCQRAKLTDPF